MEHSKSQVQNNLTIVILLGLLLTIVVFVPIINSQINSTVVGDLLKSPEGILISGTFGGIFLVFVYALVNEDSQGVKRGVVAAGESEEIVRYSDGIQTVMMRFINEGNSSATVSLEVDGDVIESDEFKTNYSFQSRCFSGETVGEFKFRYRRHHSGGTQWEIYSVPEAFV